MPSELSYSPIRMLLTAVFISMLMIGAICSARVIVILGIALPAGALYGPWAFSILAVTEEVYGLNISRRMADFGVICLALAAAMIEVTARLPGLGISDARAAAFYALYAVGISPILVTIIAVWSGCVTAAWTMELVAQRTRGRLLWLRICGAPMLAQIVATMIGLPLLLGGQIPLSELVALVLTRMVFAVFFASATAPMVYAATLYIRKREWPTPIPEQLYPGDFRANE